MGNFLKKFNIDILFYIILISFFVLSVFLSTYRDVIRDEAIYLHETFLMSELIKNGIWFGDYGVGLHGFLFKLPPALVFLFTGPSIAVVTFYNIVLACIAAFLFYKFFKEAFGWRYKAILALGILMANFHFILTTPTYLREMPSLIVIALLLYGIFKNWKPWVLGIIFLLLLDAKEYLFFMFGLGYFIWVVYKYFPTKDIKSIIVDSLQLYSLSLVYIVLMFTTSIIPINMFLVTTIGLLDTGASYLTAHFATDYATANLLEEEARTIYQFTVTEDMPIYTQVILNFFNLILSYIGKILYPRTFSFLSVPKVIVLPAIYMAYKTFKNASKDLLKVLPILLFTYLAIYLLRASHGRYLLPIVPLIAIYFVQFIHYPFENKKEILKLLIATFLFMSFGFYFEASYVVYKMIIETFLFVCIAISVLKPFPYSKYFYSFFQKITILFCIVAMLGAGILFYFTQGQGGNNILYGENREIDKIIEIIPENKNVWVNNRKSYYLMQTKMGLTYHDAQRGWTLAGFVPKKDLLKVKEEQSLFNDFYREVDLFIEYLQENNIEYLVFIQPTVEEELFEYEYIDEEENLRTLDFFKKENWLIQESKECLQNKKVYLFEVNL